MYKGGRSLEGRRWLKHLRETCKNELSIARHVLNERALVIRGEMVAALGEVFLRRNNELLHLTKTAESCIIMNAQHEAGEPCEILLQNLLGCLLNGLGKVYIRTEDAVACLSLGSSCQRSGASHAASSPCFPLSRNCDAAVGVGDFRFN